MPKEKSIIGQSSKVTMHFSLALEDGTIVDSTFGTDEPLMFTMGDGTLIAGLEYAIVGLTVGDRQSINIGPDVGFGYRDEAAIQTMKRSDFDKNLAGKDIEGVDTDLKPGVVIEFDSPAGIQVPGTIVEINDDTVKVDFSHPLAGRTVLFNVEILDVE